MGNQLNVQGIMQGFQNFMQNRGQFFGQSGLPQNMQNDPNAIIQQMMNKGSISQQQYNFAQSMAQQIQKMYQK